jgi:hypothetical protein
MRAAWAIAAALLLAACRVDVEGARCTQPGSASECPDGQACGNDLKCSARAASCGASFCKVGATLCDTSARLGACGADADPVCGSWVVRDCGANLACVERGAAHACECVANAGTELAAGAGGSALDGAAHPTGLASPPQCRFKRLGDALAAAVAHGGQTTVKVYGDPGAAVVFIGEAFPLVVPQDVTVSGADAPAGETVIHGDAGTAGPMVSLQGTLERVHLQNVSMSGDGVDVSCTAGLATLRDVIVSAQSQKFATGVKISGCGAAIERADVSGADLAALDIAVPAAAVTVTASKFHASGSGVRVTSGTVFFGPDASSVIDNNGPGLLLTGFGGITPAVKVTLNGTTVARNDSTGIVVDGVEPGSSLEVRGCDIEANGRGSPRKYGPGNPQRTAGGVFIRQSSAIPLVFKGNRVFGNAGDQLAFESDGTWSIAAADCGADSNTFACVASGDAAVGIATGGAGSVNASSSVWPTVVWNSWIFGNVTSAFYCNGLAGPPPPPAQCP